MAEQMELLPLLRQVYDIWCMKTGNPGQVSFDELKSSVFVMGDIVQSGKLQVSEDEARKAFEQVLEDLNRKSVYAQEQSFLPQVTKGMSQGAKILVLLVCVGLMIAAAFCAERVTAKTQAEQGITEAASYSIA